MKLKLGFKLPTNKCPGTDEEATGKACQTFRRIANFTSQRTANDFRRRDNPKLIL